MNKTTVYLDTARHGRMCAGAATAIEHLSKLARREGLSLNSSRLLLEGSDSALPEIRGYEGLSDWKGLDELKRALLSAAGRTNPSRVLLTGSSSALFAVARRFLANSCRRVLTTDLDWPFYRRLLRQHEDRVGSDRFQVVELQLRQAVLAESLSENELVDMVVRQFGDEECDGLLLSGVTYEGLRIPVRSIAIEIARFRQATTIVVDGAQEFGHVPIELQYGYADLYLACSHKWLGAYHPLGIGYVGRSRATRKVDHAVKELFEEGDYSDPLLTLTRGLEVHDLDLCGPSAETASLFAARAALSERAASAEEVEKLLRVRSKNLDLLTEGMSALGNWRLTRHGRNSGIMLAHARRHELKSIPPEALRAEFQRKGIALTCYPSGRVRLSAPDTALDSNDIERVSSAFESLEAVA